MTKTYVIKDINGQYGGKISIYSNNLKTGSGDYVWDYFSTIYPVKWYEGSRKNVEKEILKLRELNFLAGYDLDWGIVELDKQELIGLLREQY